MCACACTCTWTCMMSQFIIYTHDKTEGCGAVWWLSQLVHRPLCAYRERIGGRSYPTPILSRLSRFSTLIFFKWSINNKIKNNIFSQPCRDYSEKQSQTWRRVWSYHTPGANLDGVVTFFLNTAFGSEGSIIEVGLTSTYLIWTEPHTVWSLWTRDDLLPT